MSETSKKPAKKKSRNTDPARRNLRKANTENWDIIQLTMMMYDMASLIERKLDQIVIHNDEKRRLLAIMYRFKAFARSNGHHLEPKNANAFKTAELCEILFEQGKQAELARKAKLIARTERSDTTGIRFS